MRLSGIVLLLPFVAYPAVTSVHVFERSDVLGGQSFGAAGPYERIVGKAYFAVDPSLPANKLVRGIEFAPKSEQGKVEFSADVYVLKPKDSAKSNRTLLFEVANRGGKSLVGHYNLAKGSRDPRTKEEFGDGFLMEQGFTLVWLGWQFDVPDEPNTLRFTAPIARKADGPITGLVRSQFVPDVAGHSFSLADRNHRPYLVIDPADSQASLTVRSTVDGERKTLPRAQWRFAREEGGKPVADAGSVYVTAGLEPGKIYEVIYRAQDPPVAGLGLAAIRDFFSYLKYGGEESVLSDLANSKQKALGYGVSQSGRLLRTFLYDGFNADENGRKVFDGVWADVAGAGRGSFNVLFAQPSRDGSAFTNVLYPTDVFPFTTQPESDLESGATDSLLTRAREANVVPKMFLTNGSYEYWGRVAALTHISADGKKDIDPAPDTRAYFIANMPHGSGSYPPKKDAARYMTNPNDSRYIHRALMMAMHLWIQKGQQPPDSRVPRIDKGELVPLSQLEFPKLPGVKPPQYPRYAWKLDFGPDFATQGIAAIEPPRIGKRYPLLVPQVDLLGREQGGIQTPELQVALAVYTGWNFRAASTGAPDQMVNFLGSYLPLPADAEKPAKKEEYLSRINRAAQDLAQDGFLLENDIPNVIEDAGKRWDFAHR